MSVNLRTLGPAEARVVLSFREQGRDVVEAGDIIGLLRSEQTGRKVIRNLLRKGWLVRLTGGRYLLLPPERGAESLGENNPLAVASAVVADSYIGWWSAAAFHVFTTQMPATVFVAVKKQTKTRTVEDTEIRFVTIPSRKFFGASSYTAYGRTVAISNPEKTVIDCIDRPDLAGGPTELTRIVHAAMAEDRSSKTRRDRAADEVHIDAAAPWLSDRPGRTPFERSIARPAARRDPQEHTFDLRTAGQARRRHRLCRRLGLVRPCATKGPFI